MDAMDKTLSDLIVAHERWIARVGQIADAEEYRYHVDASAALADALLRLARKPGSHGTRPGDQLVRQP